MASNAHRIYRPRLNSSS